MSEATARAAAGLRLGQAFRGRSQDELAWRRALREWCELTGDSPAAVRAELELQAELWKVEA